MSTNAYVYELTTKSNGVTQSSVAAICLTVLDERLTDDQSSWTVVVGEAQRFVLRGLPWVLDLRYRGTMQLIGDNLVFRDLETNVVWTVSVESLGQ